MTKSKKIRYLFIILFIITISFFYKDVNDYYLGKSTFNYKLLPFGLTPRNETWGFTINDSSDITIIGTGFIYINYPDIEVKEILSYGYKSDYIIIKTLGVDGNLYYFKFNGKLEPYLLLKPNTSDIEIGGGIRIKK